MGTMGEELMTFTLGDALVLSVALIVVLIFRFLDRGNRSLEKVKRFTGRAQQELLAIAEEQTQQLRDLAINVEVHQQSAVKAIDQLEAAAEDLNKRTSYVEEIERRIDQYDLALKQLVDMTNTVDQNIKGIQQESAYVDGVGRSIKESQKHLEAVERTIPGIIKQFSTENRQQLETAGKAMLQESREIAHTLTEQVTAAQTQAENILATFQTDSSHFQNSINELVESGQQSMEHDLNQYQQDFVEVEKSFRERMNQTADKVRRFETEAFESLRDEISAKRIELSDSFAQAIEQQKQSFTEEFQTQQNENQQHYTQLAESLKESASAHEQRVKEIDMSVQNAINSLDEELQSRHEKFKNAVAQEDVVLEQKINEIDVRLHNTISSLGEELNRRHEKFKNAIAQEDAVLEQKLNEIDASAQNTISSLGEELHSRHETFESTIAQESVVLKQKLNEIDANAQNAMSALDEKLHSRHEAFDSTIAQESAVLEQKLNEIDASTQNSMSALDKKLHSRYETFESTIAQESAVLEQKLNEIDASTQSTISSLGEELHSRHETFDSTIAQESVVLKQKLNEIGASAQNAMSALDEKLHSRHETFASTIAQESAVLEQKLNAIDASAQNAMSALDEKLHSRHETFENTIAQEGAILEQKILGDLETRLSDYEDSITYRLSRLEALRSELDGLDKKLQENMTILGGRVEENMQELSERFQAERVEDLKGVREELEKLAGDIEIHRSEIHRITEESKASTSEQLQGFEAEFINSLTERRQNMDSRLENWMEEFNGSLNQLQQNSDDERRLIEKKYLEDISARMDILRGGLTSRIDELQSEFQDREVLIQENLSAMDDRVAKGRIAIDEQLQGLQQQSVGLLETRCNDIQEQLSVKLQDMQRNLEVNLKSMDVRMVEQEGEVKGLHEAVRSDVAVWQNQIHQQLKTEKNGMEGDVATFRVRINDILLAMREEYAGEKDGIISEGEDARAQLQTGIQDASDQLSALRSELEEKKEEALNRFNLDYKDFIQDFLHQKTTASEEIQGATREFREFVASTRDEFAGAQKRLINTLYEEMKALEVNIREIEKKQKGFLQQTKLFDRADSLKQGLVEDIDHLRREVDRFQNERKQIGEYEDEFIRIRKLGDEANEKMARFSVEQRKLEVAEENYKKLMALSTTMDNRLETINAKHDNVQQMQLAIRNMDDLQKELDQRYERLSKRKEIIDATVEGVDRNFNQITDLDTRIQDVNTVMKTVTNDIGSLKGRLESLAVNKKESDMAMRNLQNLNQLMEKVEDRTAELQKTREWLARIETRMEEVVRDADQRMEMLGAVTKQSHSRDDEERSAPSLSERDMVIKLKHQGWNIEDIAKTCKISRGEVELILEMVHR